MRTRSQGNSKETEKRRTRRNHEKSRLEDVEKEISLLGYRELDGTV